MKKFSELGEAGLEMWSAYCPAMSPDGRRRIESPDFPTGARKLYAEDGARPSKKVKEAEASGQAGMEDYITYYNTRQLQRGLGILTPLEKHELYFAA